MACSTILVWAEENVSQAPIYENPLVKLTTLQREIRELEIELVMEWDDIGLKGAKGEWKDLDRTIGEIERFYRDNDLSYQVTTLINQLNALPSRVDKNKIGISNVENLVRQLQEKYSALVAIESYVEVLNKNTEASRESNRDKEFWSHFGIGLGMTGTMHRSLIPKDGVTVETVDADTNRIVVNQVDDHQSFLLLEAHWYPLRFNEFLWIDGFTLGLGPFVAAQVAPESELIQGFGFGMMAGSAPKPKSGNVSFNLGLGTFIRNDVTLLKEEYEDGDIVSNTVNLFETVDVQQLLGVVSFNYAF